MGFKHLRLSKSEKLETGMANALLVRSMNRWRSPTAERIYSKHPPLSCRSAGPTSKAMRHGSEADLVSEEAVSLPSKITDLISKLGKIKENAT